jgi:hypothetical protein
MKTNGTELNFFEKLKDRKSVNIQEEITKYILRLFRFIKKDFLEIDQETCSQKLQEKVSKLIIDFARLWKTDIVNKSEYYIEICDGFESILTKALYNR